MTKQIQCFVLLIIVLLFGSHSLIFGETINQELIPSANTVSRTLPDDYVAGHSYTITLHINASTNPRYYAVEELLPLEWNVNSISDDGIFDSRTNKIKWGPFIDNTSKTLSYNVTAPLNPTPCTDFSGTASFEGNGTSPSGDYSFCKRVIPPSTEESIVSSTETIIQNGLEHKILLAVIPPSSTQAYAIEETIPAGWEVINISHSGTFDLRHNKIKWGLFYNNAPLTLSYDLVAPLSAEIMRSLSGIIVSKELSSSQTIVTVGDRELQPSAGILGTATSAVPNYYDSGSSVTVSIEINPHSNISAYAIESLLPLGWSASDISDAGIFDYKTNKIKWGLFFDNIPRTLCYCARAPNYATGGYDFEGNASLNGDDLILKTHNTELSAFTTWKNDFLSEHPDAHITYDSDDDNDGIPLLLEYALGLDPLDAASAQMPAAQIQNNQSIDYLTLAFRKKAIDVTYTVLGSSDLITWTPLGLTIFEVGDIDTDTVVGLPINHSSCFLKLKVEVPWN